MISTTDPAGPGHMRLLLAGMSLALAAAALTACGSDGSTGTGATSTASSEYAISMLNHRAAGTRVVTYRSFAEAMPNHAYLKRGEPVTISDAVVVGRVVGAHRGAGFFVPGESDAPSGTRIDFDDPRAQWKTVHLEVEVHDTIAGRTPGERIVVGVPLMDMTADFDRLAKSLTSLGEVIAPLKDDSPMYDYDERVHAVAGDGELLGVLVDGDRIELPFARDESGDRLAASTPTLGELREALRRPLTVSAPRGIE